MPLPGRMMTMTRVRMRRCLPVLLAVFALLLVACASKEPAAPPREPEPPPPPTPQEVSPHRRAEIHTELAAGYYERGQMEIALKELDESVKLEPNNAKTYNIYGLVYTVLGENAKAEQNFPAGAHAGAAGFGSPPELGLVPVHARAGEGIDPRVRAGRGQPALQDARDPADQRRPLQRDDR